MRKILLIKLLIFFKLLNIALRLTGKGSGTALPGLICEKYFPWIKNYLLDQIKYKIAITGTNGKTTTQTILSSILQEKGYTVLNNKAGSNMNRGITSELVKRSSISGKLNYDYGIFEIEEATFPKVVESIKPEVIIVTNLFRDQLDAYGEIDRTQKFIIDGIQKSSKSKVVLNFDDPKVREIKDKITNEVTFIDLDDKLTKNIKFEATEKLISQNLQNRQVSPNVIIGKNCRQSVEGNNLFDVEILTEKSKFLLSGIKLNISGGYQVYNALSSVATARLLGLDIPTIRKGIEKVEPAFGRGEKIMLKKGKKTVYFKLLLVKNPAGCNLNLDILKTVKNLKLILLLNDNIADGKDVSWIWDCEFEKLNECDLTELIFSGKRAYDIQLRIKYALISRKYSNTNKYIDQNINYSIKKAVELATNDETIYVLPTYTAMLEFRKTLGQKLEK